MKHNEEVLINLAMDRLHLNLYLREISQDLNNCISQLNINSFFLINPFFQRTNSQIYYDNIE